MYGAFHPKSDVDRLYLKRNEGGRGLISIEHCVRGEENILGLYVMNSKEKLIQGIRTSGTIETEGSITRAWQHPRMGTGMKGGDTKLYTRTWG